MIEKLQNFPIIGKTISFEGCDYSGKTSLIKEFTRNSNFGSNNFLSSRGFVSNIIYSEIFKRDIDIKRQIFSYEKQLNSNSFIQIFVNTDIDEIRNRLKRGDDYIKDNMIEAIHKKYIEFFLNYKQYFNIVDTKDGINFIETKSQIVFDWYILYKTLTSLNHLENYTFDYFFDKQQIIDELSYLNDYEKIIKCNVDDKFLNRDWQTIYEKDKYDFEMLKSQLFFNTHIEIDVNNQKNDSRRFLATNKTSCLSFYHAQLIDNNIEITAVLRSSNVASLLLHDFKNILSLALEFNNFIDNYEFKKINNNEIKNFKFKILIDNAHVIRRC